MNTSVLRKAIARMFPDQYSFWTWRKLLPDFVDVHLKALTIRWQRYRHQRETDPKAVEPGTPAVLGIALVKLAKQQKLSYEFLAFSHYQHLHQFGALTAENIRLRQLHKTSLFDYFSTLTPSFPEDPLFSELLQIILGQLVQVDCEEKGNQALLTTYIEQAYGLCRQQLDDYAETWEDLQDELAPYTPPGPVPELVGALTLQAILSGQTFQDLAFRAYDAEKGVERSQTAMDFMDTINGKLKANYDWALEVARQNYQIAQMYQQGIDPDNRQN